MRLLRGARAGLVLALLAASFAASADTPEDAAQKAAESWVKLVDQGKYGESWDAAASLFKAAVTRDQWVQTMGSLRAPDGKPTSRKLKSRAFSKTLPGAPEGQYVTIQYDSAFEKKPGVVETVVAMLDTDGSWRAAGYFVK